VRAWLGQEKVGPAGVSGKSFLEGSEGQGWRRADIFVRSRVEQEKGYWSS